jgi:methylmalonyl-CoA/ethylmalonyl-CoA epimerase
MARKALKQNLPNDLSGTLVNELKSEFELDHIGIAVESLESGFQFYQALGFTTLDTEVVESEKVKTGFMKLGNKANLELLEPMSDESPIRKFLDKRGPGIHHICLRVKGIDAMVERLKERGIRMINERPKMGAHNCRVAFIHPASTGGVLIELSEKANQSGEGHS